MPYKIGSISGLKAYFQETGKTPIAVDLASMVRYEKGVEALGGYGELVEKPEAIRPALDRALTCGRPACLSVMTAPEVYYGVRSYQAYK